MLLEGGGVTDENIEGLGTVKCLYVCMCARLSCHVSVAAVPVRERHHGSGLAELSVSLLITQPALPSSLQKRLEPVNHMPLSVRCKTVIDLPQSERVETACPTRSLAVSSCLLIQLMS